MVAEGEGRRARGAVDPILALAALIAFAPAAWLVADTLREMARAYTPSPFWDQWGTIGEYARAKAEGLSWGLLFAQSNEHRILFPRLVMFADLRWLGGRNLLPDAGIIAGQLALIGLLVSVALRLRNRPAAVMTLGLGAALVFSLGQWENLIWAFQVQFLMVAAAGAWSIYLFCRAFADRERPNHLAWAASLGLLVVASFSMANGLLAGAACVGVALVARFPWRAIVVQAVVLGGIAVLYFRGYAPTPHEGEAGLSGLLDHPSLYAQFVAAYLGALARAHGVAPALILGAVGLMASLAAALRVLLGRDRDAGRLTLVGVMAFVVASAMVTALGRMGYGVEQGLVSRYLTFAAVFWAAQLLYWGSLLPLRRPVAVLAAAAVLSVVAYPPLYRLQAQSRGEVASRSEQLRLGVRALRTGADDPAALEGLNWNVPMMMDQVAFLRREGLSMFNGAEDLRIGGYLDPARVEPGACLGAFDVILHAPRGAGYRAAGWGWDRRAERPLATVFLVDAQNRIVAVAEGGVPRADVPSVVPQVRSDRSGWGASIAQPAATPLAAYGLLSNGKRCDLGRAAWPA